MAQSRLRRDDWRLAGIADGPDPGWGNAPQRGWSLAEWKSRAQFLRDFSPRPNSDTKGTPGKIDANGSTVTVEPDTIVQFDGEELVLDHGGLQVNTSREMKVRLNCVTVITVTKVWSHYYVFDMSGTIHITTD